MAERNDANDLFFGARYSIALILSIVCMKKFRDESGSVYWRSSESGIETLWIFEGIGTTGVLFA